MATERRAEASRRLQVGRGLSGTDESILSEADLTRCSGGTGRCSGCTWRTRLRAQ